MRNGVEGLSFPSLRLVHPPIIFHGELKWRWRARIEGYYNLWYVIRGRGVLECDGKRNELRPGLGFIFGPGQRVDARHDPLQPVVNFAAHFVPLWNQGDARVVPELPLDATRVANPQFFAELARAAVACGRIGDALAEQQCNGLTYHLVSMLWRSHRQAPPDPVDEGILAHIEQIYARPGKRFRIPDLAAKAHLSCSQYTRRFMRLTGESPNRFIMKNRIDRACMLLRDSPLTIAEIAESLGYQDTYFFSRQFKKVMDFSPAAYRRQVSTSYLPSSPSTRP